MNGVRAWLADRFAWKPFRDGFLYRRVPRAPWYTGDGATLLSLLGVQVVTGGLMALTYSPTPDTAYDSVTHITEEQILGWFVRGLHYWAAGLMVIVLFYHLFRQVLLGGYKAPREGTWLIGVLLFYCVLFMAFVGYLLRWDERAVYGIRVMLHMISRVPWIGESLVLVAQGGPELGPRTLTQMYALHVFLVPLAIFVLAGIHLYLVVQRGTITKSERRQPVRTAEEQERLYQAEAHSPHDGETFFPWTALKSGAFSSVVLTIAVGLTIALGPPALQREANLVEDAFPAEEWWFWWYSGLIALLPPQVAPWFVVLFPIAVFAGLIALPFLDRGPARGVKHRPIWTGVVVLTVIAMLALTDYRRRSPFTGWPDPNPPEVPEGEELTPLAAEGRVLFATYGCTSCHAIAGQGRFVGTDFSTLREEPRTRDEMRSYILKPPEGIAMPAYEDRLTDEELERLVDFCHVAQSFARRL
ncbi:MAG: cytochrome b N-terminal domain-containing protein [Planctomycetaceae bacterium]